MSTQGSTPQHEEAAEWFVRLQQGGELSLSELQAWEDWIADPENRKSFAAITELWSHVECIEPPSMPGAEELVGDDYDGSESVAAWLSNRTPAAPRDERHGSVVEIRRVPSAPTPTQHVESTSARLWKRRFAHPGFAAVAAAALVAVVGLLSYAMLRSNVIGQQQTYETGTAEHRRIPLADGSIVELGARSVVRVQLTDEQRDVFIDGGEAFFEVAKDPERPFIVRAGALQLTALGTAFNVRRDADRVVVSVQEGRVRAAVNDAEEALGTLTPRQQLRYDASGSGPIERVDLERIAAWREGRLQYLYEPLSDVVGDINRYSHRQIVLDERASQLRFTGTVFPENVAGFIDQLPGIFSLQVVEADADRIVFRMNAPSGDGAARR
jgi:transmembrane sensor